MILIRMKKVVKLLLIEIHKELKIMAINASMMKTKFVKNKDYEIVKTMSQFLEILIIAHIYLMIQKVA